MVSVPLSRPDLPSIDSRLEWSGRVVAVFGPGDLSFARSIASVRPAFIIRPELRHAEGYSVDGERIYAHPDALLDALAASRLRADGALVIGVGGAFACAVRAQPTIWITGGQHRIALPTALRRIAQHADLALEEPRPALALELAKRL